MMNTQKTLAIARNVSGHYGVDVDKTNASAVRTTVFCCFRIAEKKKYESEMPNIR